jgi:hypothetical protein
LTDCPGDAFYARLPTIRPRAAALAGTPARVTLVPARSTVIAGASIVVSGRLTTLSGGPLPSAPIVVQQLTPAGEPTIAIGTTGADGSWSAVVPLNLNQSLRALHRPAPATVSDLVFVGVAPAITLGVESLSPVTVNGAITPPKRSVKIDVYLLQNEHRRLLTSKRIAVTHGQFTAKVPVRRAGRYLLRASSAPDARNVAGASPTVTITL